MNKLEFEAQIKLNKTVKELAIIFGRSLSNIRYWLKKYNLKAYSKYKRNIIINGLKVCNTCKLNKPIDQYMLRTDTHKYRGTCTECHKLQSHQIYKLRQNRHFKKKQDIIKQKGGKCEICSIQSDIVSLYELHHRDPTVKEFNISKGIGRSYGNDRLQKEINKCHLLCSNCHKEVHGGFHPNYIINKQINHNYDLSSGSKICKTCHINKPLTLYYFGAECKYCHNQRSTLRMRQIKKQCFKYKGGKCEHCNYDKYIGAIEFHHIDPLQKDFAIAKNQKNFGMSHKKELDKCLCLCSNCHKIEHARLIKSQDIVEKDTANEINQIKDEPPLIYKTNKLYENDFNRIKYSIDKIIKNSMKHSNCQDCNKNITLNSLRCNNCSKINRRKVKNRPSNSQLQDEVNKIGYCATGRKYGVSDNAIRKWMK
jgi:hypothetical protein